MAHQHPVGAGLPLMFNFTDSMCMDTETGAGEFVNPMYFETQQAYPVSQADAAMYDYIRSGMIPPSSRSVYRCDV
jgi:hypothetical protein